MANNKDKNLKIAVVHDHLGFMGGGERTALIIAIDLGADFITAYTEKDVFPEYREIIGDKFITFTNVIINTKVMRFFRIRWLYFKNRKLLKKYDILIGSGQSATEAVAFYGRKDALRISYTHTQPRRVYDLYKSSKKSYHPILRPAYAIFAKIWEQLYLKTIARININIANSNNIRSRALKYTSRDVDYIVWPPIEVEKFRWISDGDYFLSYARIDEAKRIDLIVKAFQKMPDKKLVIASGGVMLDKIKKLAHGYNNIKILGWVTTEDLVKLVGNCMATIYIPIDEDAGMTPLESHSAGKGVLGVAEGGLLQSIQEGKTGFLVKANPTPKNIIETIKKMTPEWCKKCKEACEKNAQKNSRENFIKKIKKIIEENDIRVPTLGIDASRWDDPRDAKANKRTGVEIYSKNIIENIVKLIKEKNYNLRVRLYTQRTIQRLPLQIQKHIPRRKRWTRRCLAHELKHSPIDYFFTPSYYIPKHAPKKSFATIHDVIFKNSPEKYSLLERIKQEYATRINIARAEKIITISKNSKKEIADAYGLNKEKIVNAEVGFTPWIYEKNIKKENIIFYIGRIEKKKSIDVLINAFAKIHKLHPNWKLYLAGSLEHGSDGLKQLVKNLKLKDKIKFLGHITDKEKKKYFNKAKIFIHPSSEEGSCFPLLEAWDAKIPAIIANVPVMKELAVDSALYFEAGDKDDLSEKIDKIIKDKELRKKLANSGAEKLKKKSWEKVAEKIVNTILE